MPLPPPTPIDRKKLRALALRFSEGPSNDPQQFPVALTSGPQAFPRLRLEHEIVAASRKDETTINESKSGGRVVRKAYIWTGSGVQRRVGR